MADGRLPEVFSPLSADEWDRRLAILQARRAGGKRYVPAVDEVAWWWGVSREAVESWPWYFRYPDGV